MSLLLLVVVSSRIHGWFLAFFSLSCADDVELTGHATSQKKDTKKLASERQDNYIVLSKQRPPCCNYKEDGEAQIRQLSVLPSNTYT